MHVSAPADRRSLLRRAAPLLAVALACVHVGLAATSAARSSATFDEGFHIVAGAVKVRTGDARLHSGNGWLAEVLFGLPIALAPDRFRVPNPDAIVEHQRVRDFHELTVFLAHVLFYEVGNDPAELLGRARLPAFALGAALCLLVFAWSRRCFGALGGLVSCALCALSPNVLAHARLATSDLVFTLALLGAVGAAWRSLLRPTPARIALAGGALGALALTKLSALGALPMLALLVVARAAAPAPLAIGRATLARPLARAAALAGVVAIEGAIAVAVIWGAYGMRFDAVPEGRAGRATMDHQWAWARERDSSVLRAIDAARAARLLPEAYLFSAAFVWRQAEERRSFFAGEVHTGGDPLFFPTAIATKTPLSLFALLALSAGGAVASALRARRRALTTNAARTAADASAPPGDAHRAGAGALTGLLPLGVVAVVHGALVVTSDINLGLRHALPLYPVAFVLAGGAARIARGAAGAAAVALGVVAFASASLGAWPHYLAYFNALLPPERAYRVFVDSSLDWGQELDALGDALRDAANPPGAPREPVYLSYFGTADPLFHASLAGLGVRRLPGFFDWPSRRAQWDRVDVATTLEPGLYAISATMLQQAWSTPSRAGTPDEEREHAALAARFAPLFEAAGSHEAELAALRLALAVDPGARAAWQRYAELRLARLCRVLREREPDAEVGHAILLYRVSEAELARVRAGGAAAPAAPPPASPARGATS